MQPTDYSDNLEQTQETTEHAHRLARQPFEAAIACVDQLITHLAGIPDGDLIGEMITNTIKLLRDQNNRGDLKLVNKSFKELRYALKVFTPYRDVRKVSIFGSARTPADHPDYLQAEAFAREMARIGWMVITGAGGGIMAAGHGGAGPEPSFGLAIRLPFEQQTNRFIRQDKKLINFKYFFTRKLMFLRSSHAVTLFPGGFGTMDEGFEVLTLIQTGKAAPMPVVMLDSPGGSFWTQWQHYVENTILASKLISPEDLSLYRITDSAEQAIEEITRFYRNFHSARYHRDHLILRLQKHPTAHQIRQINRDFADICTTGDFHTREPLPVERDEPDIAHLHRLVFCFNKRDQGRLRQLINRLNEFAD